MSAAARPTHYALWQQAQREKVDEGERAVAQRYRELMIEHGHLVPAGDPRAAQSRDGCSWRPRVRR